MSKVLYISQKANTGDSVSGGAVVNKRNKKLLENVFDEVFVFEYQDKSSSKLKKFFLSLFGIDVGLTKNVINEISDILKNEQVDYIFLGSARIGKLARLFKGYKSIVFFHNVEYLYIQERLKNSSRLIKFASKILVRNVKKNEMEAVKYGTYLLVLNKRDSNDLMKLYNRSADFLLPITMNDNFNYQIAKDNDVVTNDKKLLFVGSDFFGNTEGLFWFIENCMEKINAKLVVVGNGMDKYKDKYQSNKIKFLGFVDDLGDEYYSSDLVVLPILSGSGMKTKTCEALMYGKKIVGSKEAFEGYSTELFSINSCILCNSAQEYIDKINDQLVCETTKICISSHDVFCKLYLTNSYVQQLKELFFQN